MTPDDPVAGFARAIATEVVVMVRAELESFKFQVIEAMGNRLPSRLSDDGMAAEVGIASGNALRGRHRRARERIQAGRGTEDDKVFVQLRHSNENSSTWDTAATLAFFAGRRDRCE